MVILTPITINNHFNNANYVTKVDHLCSERHTFNFLLKKVDFRGTDTLCIDSTSIKVHPDAAGARKSNGEQSIGRSKGG